MQEEGHETTFFASDSIEPAWKPFLKKKQFDLNETWSAHSIQRFPSITIANKPFLKKPFKFIRAVKLKQADIIHLLGLAYPVNQLALIASLLTTKAPVFVNEHGTLESNKKSLIARLFYLNAYLVYQIFGRRKIKAFIAPNEESKAFIIDRYGVPPEKIHIIPLGYNDELFKVQENTRNKNSSKLVIGFAGKINAEKKVDRLLNVLTEVSCKENIICRIAGFNDSNREIREQLELFAKENGITLECLPFLNSLELASFYNTIDLAIFPGSISITTIEANACGTPILLFESILGLENRVADGRGFLFKTNEELSQLIKHYFGL
jgi:glycosyltransferase involved in cell wall biosynthesis